MLQVGQHYLSAAYLRSEKVFEQSEEILNPIDAIIDAIAEGDNERFSELLQDVDINTYYQQYHFEEEYVLISWFLLSAAAAWPPLEGAEVYIQQILDKKPDLTLPIMKEGIYKDLNLREGILEVKKTFEEDEEGYTSIREKEILARFQFILDYLNSNGHILAKHEEISELVAAISQGDNERFSELLQDVDINTYYDQYEDYEYVLVSQVLLFTVAMNPELEGAEVYIRQILDKKPDLSLPVIRGAYKNLNLKEWILEIKKHLIEEGGCYSLEQKQEVLARFQLIFDNLEPSS